jgi:UDP-2,4-diacetamido-2,4,6-trideoxy-beta-L-altropyranose hydrolase
MRVHRVGFRTDASLDIGTGHVIRCLTLADALRERGARCSFVCREHPGHLLDLIRARGHEVYALPLIDAPQLNLGGTGNDHAGWLGADWASDAQQTLAAMHGMPVDWMVVDHYALDARWEKQVGAHCGKLLVIDDLADRLHDCDLLLDQNLNRQPSDYEQFCLARTVLLVGPDYALLRPDFAELRSYSFARRSEGRLGRLLISMGGVDKDNVTGDVLSALTSCNLPEGCKTTVVMGMFAPWLAQVRAQAEQMNSVEVWVNVQNMAQLIAESDLAIGAAGTSAWERCCLGLPTLTMVLAANQLGGATSLRKNGAVLLLEGGSHLPQELSAKVNELCVAQNLKRIQDACRTVCDGMGVSRVMEAMSHAN